MDLSFAGTLYSVRLAFHVNGILVFGLQSISDGILFAVFSIFIYWSRYPQWLCVCGAVLFPSISHSIFFVDFSVRTVDFNWDKKNEKFIARTEEWNKKMKWIELFVSECNDPATMKCDFNNEPMKDKHAPWVHSKNDSKMLRCAVILLPVAHRASGPNNQNFSSPILTRIHRISKMFIN